MFRYVKRMFLGVFKGLFLDSKTPSSSFNQWPRTHISHLHVTCTIRLRMEYGSQPQRHANSVQKSAKRTHV